MRFSSSLAPKGVRATSRSRSSPNFTTSNRATVTGFNLGQSFIWLAHPQFNVLLETVWTGQGAVARTDRTAFSHSLFVSPAIRWAHNLASGLQIVPGIGYAIGAGPSSDSGALLFYLSLEHPFGAAP